MLNKSAQNFLVVLGREWIDGRFDTEPDRCQKREFNNTVIISTPDVLKLKGEHMLDLMALTNPGPHLFLVVLEEGKKPEEELRKWEKVFGEDISHNMIYITDRHYEFSSTFSGKCISINEDLTKQCEPIINKDNLTSYSFGQFLNRRREQFEGKMYTEMEINQSSGPAPGDQWKSQQVTLVLIGESGSGKSASGNTILGEKAFISKPSSMPVTTECKMKTKSFCGAEVTVIDTPDFFDEDLQEPSKQILRCRELCGQKDVLCVYLLVIQIGRFTEGERDILERLEKALETKVRDRAIILFTRGDDLKSHIDEFVKKTNPHLKQLIKKCDWRYQVFNNTTLVFHLLNEKGGTGWFKSFLGVSNPTSHRVEKQVEELMEKIVKLV